MAESVIVERKKFVRSLKYKYWKSVIDLRRCMECKKHQGKIYLLYDIFQKNHRSILIVAALFNA